MVPAGLCVMFESERSAPRAGDLSVVGCDAEPDASADMLAGTWANLQFLVVLSRPSGAGDNGHCADRGSSANATCPGLDVVGAVETVGEAVGLASWILVPARSCSGHGVESVSLSALYG